MLLLVQLTAARPELKLLVSCAAVHAVLLQQSLTPCVDQQHVSALGWRVTDRSQSPASPDCLVLADAEEEGRFYPLQSLPAVTELQLYNLKEICVYTGTCVLQGDEFVTVLLDIDTNV